MTTSTEIDPFGAAPPAATRGPREDENGVRRDGYGRYLLPHPETGKETAYTRATTFAKSISDTYTLSMWQQRMVGIGVAQNPDLVATFAGLKPDDRQRGNDAAEEAKNRAGAKTGANLGTALHTFTEKVDRGESLFIPPPWDRDVKAYRALLDQEGIEVLPDLIERRVLNRRFSIAGTLDRIVRLTQPLDFRRGRGVVTIPAGSNVIADLKTGRDLEYGWMEIAIQLSLYACEGDALLYDPETNGYDPFPVRSDYGLVIHLPVGQGRATLHAVDLESGVDLSILCERVRTARKVKGLSAPVAVCEVPKGGDVATTEGPIRVASERVREPAMHERIKAARTLADLAAIRDRAMIDKTWTPTVERLALERKAQIAADTVGG